MRVDSFSEASDVVVVNPKTVAAIDKPIESFVRKVFEQVFEQVFEVCFPNIDVLCFRVFDESTIDILSHLVRPSHEAISVTRLQDIAVFAQIRTTRR